MIDEKIGAALIFAAFMVALWAHIDDRRAQKKGRKIRERVREASTIPPRRVLQAYNQAMLRESFPQTQAASFALGVALAAKTCLSCANGNHGMYGADCDCACHERRAS